MANLQVHRPLDAPATSKFRSLVDYKQILEFPDENQETQPEVLPPRN